jgi:uncharacterized NAD-dependent epimerase/dehydratase family protein
MKKKNAIVYCDEAFNTPNGKTAHGLVRFTERYNVIAVIDKIHAGSDALMVLDGKQGDIPVVKTLEKGIDYAKEKKIKLQSFVIGLAPDGGRLPKQAKKVIEKAIEQKLDIDSGLHDFISNDTKLVKLAKEKKVKITDVRKTPDRDKLHFFTGDIEKVKCLKLAVLGTDSALGKRTTAWIIVHGFRNNGKKAEMIGTGQTAWMQGAKYSMIMDSCINDFVSGEIEHAIVSAWNNENPDVLVIEGQGSLMNPAYPGGFEILAAGRPDYIILQHAPRRVEYDGFPGYLLHDIKTQINAIEMISSKKVIAITLNHEGMKPEEIEGECKKMEKETGLPTFDVLAHGADGLIKQLLKLL